MDLFFAIPSGVTFTGLMGLERKGEDVKQVTMFRVTMLFPTRNFCKFVNYGVYVFVVVCVFVCVAHGHDFVIMSVPCVKPNPFWLY